MANAQTGFSVDLTKVKKLPPLPDGRYNAAVATCKPGMSKTKNPKFDVQFKIIEDDEWEGRSVFDTLSFHEDAMWRTKQVLTCLNVPEDFAGQITPTMLIGERCVITVATEEQTEINPQTGEPWPARPRVKAVAPYGSAVGIDEILADAE